MNNQSMIMNSDNLKTVTQKINEKIRLIEDCYSDIRKNIKYIDGSNDNWKGNNQINFYNIYFNMSKKFPENIKKFNDFNNFLINVIKSYEERDKGISTDLDKNADNFNI